MDVRQTTDLDTKEDEHTNKDQQKDNGQRGRTKGSVETTEEEKRTDERKNNEIQRKYSKEATVIVNVAEIKDGKAEDVIKAVINKVGPSKVLAVRPRINKEYEITLTDEEACEELMDGLMIKDVITEVRNLQTKECVVSIMHLPVYITDEEIRDKLRVWGVTTISAVKRRYYPGTTITDGTRFVRAKFPKEIVSLPYSTKFETAEGMQYFRIIHDRQVKTCRLCMNPGHILMDCPDFKCHKCGEKGHFIRDCDAVCCPDCKEVMDRCECWMEGEEEEEEQQVGGRVHERDNEQREDETRVRGEGPESNNNTEQQKECNEQDIQTQQDGGFWTQMVLTGSLQSALDTVELDDQRNKELSDAQQEGILFTQMDVTDSLQKVLDTVELNDQSNKEQSATKESEQGKENEETQGKASKRRRSVKSNKEQSATKESEQGKENEETQGKASKRRRSVKVVPNLETARKRVPKDDGIESTNKYELLKGLEEMD
ncbi:uncharacterized protein LOC107706004 [Sinocyclocheilus rhinocerous]|uniref:uncharacterized protein LOC107706004 n=1 Tax=Sinocyclocheilus rhinocerous TaxID=307959 RepID=UPI0007B9DDD8|nr:PREDICTED: uncharacterized protein LOC107706004 [Sinocyclocheilus rhinocerous]